MWWRKLVWVGSAWMDGWMDAPMEGGREGARVETGTGAGCFPNKRIMEECFPLPVHVSSTFMFQALLNNGQAGGWNQGCIARGRQACGSVCAQVPGVLRALP